MILVTHFLVASELPLVDRNPLFLAVFGFLSHLILDMFPHWQYSLEGDTVARNAAKGVVDLLCGVAITTGALIVRFHAFSLMQFMPFYFAGFMGCVPDMLWFLLYLFPDNRILQRYAQAHKSLNSSIRLERPAHALWQAGIIAAAIFILVTL